MILVVLIFGFVVLFFGFLSPLDDANNWPIWSKWSRTLASVLLVGFSVPFDEAKYFPKFSYNLRRFLCNSIGWSCEKSGSFSSFEYAIAPKLCET